MCVCLQALQEELRAGKFRFPERKGFLMRRTGSFFEEWQKWFCTLREGVLTFFDPDDSGGATCVPACRACVRAYVRAYVRACVRLSGIAFGGGRCWPPLFCSQRTLARCDGLPRVRSLQHAMLAHNALDVLSVSI